MREIVAQAERDGAICSCGSVSYGAMNPCRVCDPTTDRRTPMQRRLDARRMKKGEDA
jgi:hypothetical protein